MARPLATPRLPGMEQVIAEDPVFARHLARVERLASKDGTTAWNANFDKPTKVIRVPEDWDRDDLLQRLELMHSALMNAEDELAQAKARAGGHLSNRFEKVAELVQELREAFPRRSPYNALADQEGP